VYTEYAYAGQLSAFESLLGALARDSAVLQTPPHLPMTRNPEENVSRRRC
jgi:hypothetical protein